MREDRSASGVRKHGRRYYEEKRYYHSKWVTFSAAAVLMLSAGLVYAFGVYGPALQTALGYSQRQIAGLGTAANMGAYAALFAGLFYDWAKRYKRYGPRMCAAIGCLLYSGGFYGLYAVGRGYIRPPYWVVVVLAIAANNGGCWLESAALVTTLQNFETERGSIVGLLKSFLGLSASIYTTLYVTFISPDAIGFLLLLAWLPSLITLVCVCGVNHVPFVQVEPHTKSHAFHLTLVAILSMATYQLVSALFFAHERYTHGEPPDRDVALMCCIAVIGLLVPVLSIPFVFGGLRAVPLPEEQDYIPHIERPDDQTYEPIPSLMGTRCPSPQLMQSPTFSHSTEEPSLSHFQDSFLTGSPFIDVGSAKSKPPSEAPSRAGTPHADALNAPLMVPVRSHNICVDLQDFDNAYGSMDVEGIRIVTDEANLSPAECLRSLNFWLVCASVGIVTGAGLAYINNIGSIVRSAGGDHETPAILVSVYSVASCVGRFSTAFIPEKAFRDHSVPRTRFLAIVALLAACACVLNAFYTLDLLPVCSLLTGCLFGFTQGLAPTIVSEVFGLTHFASNYAMMNTMLISCSLGMATVLMSEVYEWNTPTGASACVGRHCFRLAFLGCAALCGVAFLCAVLLSARTQQIYSRLHEKISTERNRRGLKGRDFRKDAAIKLMKWRVRKAVQLLNTACGSVHGMAAGVRSLTAGTIRRRSGAGAASELPPSPLAPDQSRAAAAALSRRAGDEEGAAARSTLSMLVPAASEIVVQDGPAVGAGRLHKQLQELHTQLMEAFAMLADGLPSHWPEVTANEDSLSIHSRSNSRVL